MKRGNSINREFSQPPSVWLPEPSVVNNTYARRDEHTLDWLARSTIPRAKEYRRFLNDQISKLPKKFQREITKVLSSKSKWESTFFELIVGRLLQEMGASIEYEIANRAGGCPDFVAQFPDAPVVVEVTGPVFTVDDREIYENPLLEIIESHTPQGWGIGVYELPNIGPNDSKKKFKRVVESMLNIPPPSENDQDKELTAELPKGTIHLYLRPRSTRNNRLLFVASNQEFRDSEERIRHAVKDKRRQVRGSNTPVLLAIRAGYSSDLEDFDLALFGRKWGRYDKQYKLVETRFRPDGIFNEQRDKPSTYAGVLAFLTVGFTECTEPIVYRHPRFSGTLPEAVQQLEQRIYNKETSEIQNQPAKLTGLVEQLNLVKV